VAGDGFVLRIQGRIDGVIVTGPAVLLEEIKTVQGHWNGEADPLHLAQAKIYGHMYAQEHGLEQIELRLTYLNLDTGKLAELQSRFSRAELATFFEATAADYLEWMREQLQWRRERDQSIRSLDFPFRRHRSGQRELADAVRHAITREERLFLEAPTGIGKTISVLYPAIQAMAEGQLERLFYLTARTTARTVAEKAFHDLRQGGLRLRTLTLTAREKICVLQGLPCDPVTCPLARGYYDRWKSAMREALVHEEITRAVIESIAQRHLVCPFQLSLDLCSWVDAVVCDYNYAFDPHAYLRAHFAEPRAEYLFLIDEAHNLVDRAREMFSADLGTSEIDRVLRPLKRAAPGCARALSKLSSAIRALGGAGEAAQISTSGERVFEPDLFFDAVSKVDCYQAVGAASASPPFQPEAGGVHVECDLSAELVRLVELALQEAELWLVRNEPAEFRSELLELYFRLHSFRRVAARFDKRYRAIVQLGPGTRVRLFCVDPSHLLRLALERAKSAVFFSATLSPLEYYRELLGGNPDDPILQLASPFPPENLAVLVQDRIRTQFKHRAETLREVVDAIAALVQARQGNYLAYLPSFEYLNRLRELFERIYPGIRVLGQRPGLTDAERDQFLSTFAAETTETQLGFAVMGGVFGEGIDLVGDRLIGAVIVGVGLPQLCLERDLIRAYFEEKIGRGFDYAYTFPGMNRVLQAIGRVIRSETDRGAVLLIDTRFGERRYGALFPQWWRPWRVRATGQLGEALHRFWEGDSDEACD
jgi:DNA excision repair protein ERCC-2